MGSPPVISVLIWSRAITHIPSHLPWWYFRKCAATDVRVLSCDTSRFAKAMFDRCFWILFLNSWEVCPMYIFWQGQIMAYTTFVVLQWINCLRNILTPAWRSIKLFSASIYWDTLHRPQQNVPVVHFLLPSFWLWVKWLCTNLSLRLRAHLAVGTYAECIMLFLDPF